VAAARGLSAGPPARKRLVTERWVAERSGLTGGLAVAVVRLGQDGQIQAAGQHGGEQQGWTHGRASFARL
jgi:hypothetical protein